MFEAVKRCADDAYAEMNILRDEHEMDQDMQNTGMYIKSHKSSSTDSVNLRPDSISFFAFCVWYLMMTKDKTNHNDVHSNFGYNMWGSHKAVRGILRNSCCVVVVLCSFGPFFFPPFPSTARTPSPYLVLFPGSYSISPSPFREFF